MSYYQKKIKSLNDIKSGYVCKTRDGELYMCLRSNQEKFDKILANQEEIIYGNCYDELDYHDELDYRSYDSKDITEVYGLVSNHYNPYRISTDGRLLLYKRADPKELTVEQISELLGYEVKVVGK